MLTQWLSPTPETTLGPQPKCVKNDTAKSSGFLTCGDNDGTDTETQKHGCKCQGISLLLHIFVANHSVLHQLVQMSINQPMIKLQFMPQCDGGNYTGRIS